MPTLALRERVAEGRVRVAEGRERVAEGRVRVAEGRERVAEGRVRGLYAAATGLQMPKRTTLGLGDLTSWLRLNPPCVPGMKSPKSGA
jgi:hypothetical protein